MSCQMAFQQQEGKINEYNCVLFNTEYLQQGSSPNTFNSLNIFRSDVCESRQAGNVS